MALPKDGDRQNLLRLRSLLDVLQPRQLLFLGDLFHSDENKHVNDVIFFLNNYPKIRKMLVIGNHDIMEKSSYESLGLEVIEDQLEWSPFLFTHEPAEEGKTSNAKGENYQVSGHIHPGVRLTGKGRQSLTLPCFYFGAEHAILPAFGNFTGLHRIRPVKGDRVFTIVNKSIVPFF